MGCVQSKENFIPDNNGDETAYHDRFLEDKILGEGEFGVVKLVHDMKSIDATTENLACKTLKKGITFKDNTLYAPLKPEVLKVEVAILRKLAGMHYNLKLIGVYESSSVIRVVTELCEGGEMMEYVSQTMTSGLRTEDVSRIAYQLLDAVNHCATNGVIHRDIKPENVMFRHKEMGSELRLIDYGSATMDGFNKGPNSGSSVEQAPPDGLIQHTTFAGSAFYISPEMFQRTYTSKTDVWSVGATLYVLVAGYPADQLQKAFNMLQKKNRDLRTLPNMPDNMPDSYYDMLEGLLIYQHKKRKSAGEMLQCEFVQFHKEMMEDEEGGSDTISPEAISAAAAAAAGGAAIAAAGGSGSLRGKMGRTKSVLLEGSVGRHQAYMGYQKFERAVTTLLATVLTRSEFQTLLTTLSERLKEKSATVKTGDGNANGSSMGAISEMEEKKDEQHEEALQEQGGVEVLMVVSANTKKLKVIKIVELKALLKELGYNEPIAMMDKLPNASTYENFAYHVALLKQFRKRGGGGGGGSSSSATGSSSNRQLERSQSLSGGSSSGGRGGGMSRAMSMFPVKRGNGGGSGKRSDWDLDDSLHSNASGSSSKGGNNSVRSEGVFARRGSGSRRGGGMMKSMSMMVRRTPEDNLNNSSHM